MNDSATLSPFTSTWSSSTACWNQTSSSLDSPATIVEGPKIAPSTSVATSSRSMSASTTWITATATITSVFFTTSTTMSIPINSLVKPTVETPSPTGSAGMSAIQVVGIATAVVFGTLLLLAMGAASVLCCRRVKPPSHSFAPLKNADDEPPDESPLFLHISHDKSAWVSEEAEPLAWSTPPQAHTPTTPVSSGASYIGTMATVGSAADLEAGTTPPENTDRRELREALFQVLARPPSRRSRGLSWSDFKRRIQQRSRSNTSQEVDSGIRLRDISRGSTTSGPLHNAPPAYTET